MALSKDDYRVKYRPLRYADLWQGPDDPTIKHLIEEEKAVKYPAGMIYHGDFGCGKTTAARIRGMRSSCWEYERDPVEPCAECLGCQECMKNPDGPDYFEYDATHSKLRANVDRGLRRTGIGKRNSHPYMPRVFFIDEAHRATEETQRTLLKDILEHQEVIFILSTREPDRLQPGIRKHCKMYHFKAPKIEIVASRLEEVARQENLVLEPGVAQMIAERKKGVPRDCLGILYELSFGGREIKLADAELIIGDDY
jgi:DNA polymerase III gamma/tau subunit